MGPMVASFDCCCCYLGFTLHLEMRWICKYQVGWNEKNNRDAMVRLTVMPQQRWWCEDLVEELHHAAVGWQKPGDDDLASFVLPLWAVRDGGVRHRVQI